MNPFLRNDPATLGGQNIFTSLAGPHAQAPAPALAISATRRYRVGANKRWFRGECSAEGGKQ